MKKYLSVFIAIAFALVMNVSVYEAANVTSITATESSDGTISVSGTTESSVLAVAVIVYDEAGENVVAMQTTSVSDGTFSDTIATGAAATYTVKVADYAGGTFSATKVSVEGSSTSSSVSNSSTAASSSTTSVSKVSASGSKTSDSNHPMFWIGILAASAVGGIGLLGYNKNRKS